MTNMAEQQFVLFFPPVAAQGIVDLKKNPCDSKSIFRIDRNIKIDGCKRAHRRARGTPTLFWEVLQHPPKLNSVIHQVVLKG